MGGRSFGIIGHSRARWGDRKGAGVESRPGVAQVRCFSITQEDRMIMNICASANGPAKHMRQSQIRQEGEADSSLTRVGDISTPVSILDPAARRRARRSRSNRHAGDVPRSATPARFSQVLVGHFPGLILC